MNLFILIKNLREEYDHTRYMIAVANAHTPSEKTEYEEIRMARLNTLIRRAVDLGIKRTTN